MEARKKTLAVLDRHLRASHLDPRLKIAGFDPEQFKSKSAPVDNQLGNFLKRAIPRDFSYNPNALKPLAQTLWAMSVALGHVLTAHRQLSRVKSSTISPDGLIGGRGYVMSIKDVRKALYDAAEGLSAISDTVHDELNAPHWKSRLGELEKGDIESVERLVGEAEQNLENPEEEAAEDMEQAEKEGERAEMEEGEGETASELPQNADTPDVETVDSLQVKQASEYTYCRTASSIPVETLSGPRVDHLDRGDQTGPFGSYNTEEPMSTKDEWSRTDGVPTEYLYQSEWDNELLDRTAEARAPVVASVTPKSVEVDTELAEMESRRRMLSANGVLVRSLATPTRFRTTVTPETIESDIRIAEGGTQSTSALPGNLTDTTPTEGYDFGVGYGEGNDAHGQGAGGYGTIDSDGKGVYGPYAVLPDDPGAGSSEEDGTTPVVELAVGRSAEWKTSSSKLPLDVLRSVARSDYYDGDKGDNEVNATSALPAVDGKANYEAPRDMQPGTSYSYEQGDQPYIKWDSDTRNMRPPDYMYQREIEGPFEREG